VNVAVPIRRPTASALLVILVTPLTLWREASTAHGVEMETPRPTRSAYL
jgi:hypothetical protein